VWIQLYPLSAQTVITMDDFKVGDVAVIVYSALPWYPVGTEVTILEIVGPPYSSEEYLVDRMPDGCLVYAGRRCLRKKRPPDEVKREELGEWDLCPWKPGLPTTVSGNES